MFVCKNTFFLALKYHDGFNLVINNIIHIHIAQHINNCAYHKIKTMFLTKLFKDSPRDWRERPSSYKSLTQLLLWLRMRRNCARARQFFALKKRFSGAQRHILFSKGEKSPNNGPIQTGGDKEAKSTTTEESVEFQTSSADVRIPPFNIY